MENLKLHFPDSGQHFFTEQQCTRAAPLQTEHVNHSFLLFVEEEHLNTSIFGDSQNGPH